MPGVLFWSADATSALINSQFRQDLCLFLPVTNLACKKPVITLDKRFFAVGKVIGKRHARSAFFQNAEYALKDIADQLFRIGNARIISFIEKLKSMNRRRIKFITDSASAVWRLHRDGPYRQRINHRIRYAGGIQYHSSWKSSGAVVILFTDMR